MCDFCRQRAEAVGQVCQLMWVPSEWSDWRQVDKHVAPHVQHVPAHLAIADDNI